jgi:hypothetical protein
MTLPLTTKARRINLRTSEKGKPMMLRTIMVAYDGGRIAMDWSSVGEIFVGVMGGGLISTYFSWQASKELRREANEIRKYNIMLIDFLDDAGVIDVKRDAEGNPIQVRVRKVSMGATATGVASLQTKVIRRGEQDDSHEMC